MSRILPLFVVLAACQTAVPGSSDAKSSVVEAQMQKAGIDEAASTSGYSYDLGSARDVMGVLPYLAPCDGCLANIEERVAGLGDVSCPTVTAMDGYYEVEGGCVTSTEVVFEGRMIVRAVDGARIVVFEGFELHELRAGFDFVADGSFREQGDEGGREQSFNLTYSWHDGGPDDGRYAYDVDVWSAADGSRTVSGEVWFERGDDEGSFAVRSALAPVSDCAGEPVGTIELLGKDEAILTLDGDKTCDACGSLSLGGGEAETLCQ